MRFVEILVKQVLSLRSKNAVCAELNLEYGDGFNWKTQDNEDMGCYLFIRF